MITLSTARLQDFQKRTQYINIHPTLPLLAYLKLYSENGNFHLIKNNLAAVCVMVVGEKAPEDFPPLLLDNRILTGYINTITTSPEIQISWTDKEITITDGKQPISFERFNPDEYPKIPDYKAANCEYKFSQKLLQSIKTAAEYINDSSSMSNLKFIHLGGEYIFAMHGSYFYLSNQFNSLPELRLDKSQANILTSLEQEIEFGSLGNHYFFLSGDSIFIFTQQEGTSPVVGSILDRLKLPGRNFTIQKSDMVSFCSAANIVSESPISECNISPGEIKMLDKQFNRKTRRAIPNTGEFDPFNFDSRLLQAPAKAIPYETLQAKTNQNTLIITGQDEYFCFIGMAAN